MVENVFCAFGLDELISFCGIKSLYFPEFYNILGFATISDTKFNYSISPGLSLEIENRGHLT